MKHKANRRRGWGDGKHSMYDKNGNRVGNATSKGNRKGCFGK